MELLLIVIATISATITAFVTIYSATRLGIGPIAKAANEQYGRLVSGLKDRVVFLEEENTRLKLENTTLEARVSRLEGELLDFLISQRHPERQLHSTVIE